MQVLGFAPSAVDALRARLGVLPAGRGLAGERHRGRVPAPPRAPAGSAPRQGARGVARRRSTRWRGAPGGASDAAASRTGWPSASRSRRPSSAIPRWSCSTSRPRVSTRAWPGRCASSSRPRPPRATAAERSSSRATTCRSSRRSATQRRSSIEGASIASGSMAELTASNEEVRIELAPGTRRGTEPGQVPLAPIRDLATVDERRLRRRAPRARHQRQAPAGRRRDGDRPGPSHSPAESGSHQRRRQGPRPRAARHGPDVTCGAEPRAPLYPIGTD